MTDLCTGLSLFSFESIDNNQWAFFTLSLSFCRIEYKGRMLQKKKIKKELKEEKVHYVESYRVKTESTALPQSLDTNWHWFNFTWLSLV